MANAYKFGAAAIAIAAVIATPVAAQDVDANDGVVATSSGDDSSSASSSDGRVTVRSSDVDPRYGNIDPFYGKIDPFYGDIGAFWGDIGPFYGNIGPFYGTINPFWDDISPFYGDIGAFWGKIDPFYGNIGPFNQQDLAAMGKFWSDTAVLFRQTEETWAALETAGLLQAPALTAQLNGQLADLIARSNAQWGSAVAAETGQDFNTAFVAPMLARHGIDLNNPASLANLTVNERAAFYLDWHDGLMAYSGLDHVDHWMASINWTPAITQIQGAEGNTIIGILDSTITGSGDLADNVISATGNQTFVNGHGAGVASLLVASHDGRGVMGIAPNASVVSHNPFDDTETASWDDVRTGINHLNWGGASIINLSLGEQGTPFSSEWHGIFTDPSIHDYWWDTTYVLAAGNEGVAQVDDIEWAGAFQTEFLLVGSVRPDGTISDFSNTPGNACLLTNGVCRSDSDLLMNHFIVAPGEFILVDDGHGGTVRRSGTSFAAPLVSGAIALLHDRWPWLANYSDASVEIILRSARDLGAPGVDPVYGVGMLDVVASQSPLDFNAMTFTMFQYKGRGWKSSRQSASQLFSWGVPDWWQTGDVFFTMYEDVGGTWRDFAVPMSRYTKGKRTTALGGGYLRMQDFVSDRFARWVLSRGADSNGDGVAGISQLYTGRDLKAGAWNLNYTSAMPRMTDEGALDPVHASAQLSDPSGRFAFDIGYGQGAMALSGKRFGVISDFNREHGGVNPVLGFASGEFFTSASMAIGDASKVRIGYTQNRLDWDEQGLVDPLDRLLQTEFGAHEAFAFTADLEQRVSDRLSVNLQYTNLVEEDALLGVQSDIEGFLGEGSRTQAATLSATYELGARTQIDLSATMSETELSDGQFLSTEQGALGSAAQIAITQKGILQGQDSLRVTLGQPLTIERGDVQLRSLEVIDRATGERGMVTHNIGIETKRRVMGEFVYASPLLDRGEIGLFGRYVSEGSTAEGDGLMVGANLGWRF